MAAARPSRDRWRPLWPPCRSSSPLRAMTSFFLALAVGIAGALAARSLHRARALFRPTLLLRFETAPARARNGWKEFWARDPFVQAQRNRSGMALGTYAVPGGDPITTHLAPNDLLQHTLILGA